MTGLQILLLDTPIDYTVRESARAKHAQIHVDLRGVVVILPLDSTRDPEAVLRTNAEWVREKQSHFSQLSTRLPDRIFKRGATLPYRGIPHTIIIETRSYSVVDPTRRELRLAAHHVNHTSVKRAVETLYRRTARTTFETHATEIAAEMGVQYRRLEVRNQRTKWGSCSSTGTISLNWRLIMAPPAVLRYVVVHELAHRIEANHSDRFWFIVERYDTDYVEHNQWLSENRHKLIFTREDC